MRTSVRRLLFVTVTTGQGTLVVEVADRCAGVQARFSLGGASETGGSLRLRDCTPSRSDSGSVVVAVGKQRVCRKN
jgi:hypothetical protein